MKLVTKAEWETMNPYSQGYVLYLQEELPGSELKGVPCPYDPHSKEEKEFSEGSFKAMLDVQDGEE
jgi:hypothetical protein